jgi:Carbohydrate family 9 binding domain-like
MSRLLFIVLLTCVAARAASGQLSTGTSPWGEDRACLQGAFTRAGELTERAQVIEPLNQDAPFSLRFRFQTVDQGSYAGMAFVGVRKEGGDFKTNGAGVTIFRHNDQLGLIGNAFIADGEGTLHTNKEAAVSLEYGTVYDVRCAYAPETRAVTATFTVATTGEQTGEPAVVALPPDKTWTADRLACWNYADGHNPRSRLSLLLDGLQLNDAAPLTFASGLEDLPLGDEERYSIHQDPEPPMISAVSGPRDVFNKDVTFTASARADVSGTVRFALKTWAGDTLWQGDAPITDGKASILFPGADAAAMEKGSRVLVAALRGNSEESACIAVRLRGRVFREVVETPDDMQSGDEIIIADPSLLTPGDAISSRSEKGKWWRRGYTTAGDSESHEMVCVEEQDRDDPESCLAPQLTLPLNLDGWYEVWVRTYRHEINGGVDVRLSKEKYFVHMDPRQVSAVKHAPHPPDEVLVDVLYRAADLTGQDIVFQQPYGTYESEHLLANASLAGVRLVRLSGAQVARIQTERARPDVRITGYDNDGFSYFWRWGTHNEACIARLLEPLRDQSADFLNISLGGLGGIIIPTPFTGMYQMTGHTRHGDYRANAFFRWCFENDVNIVDVLCERAHEVGLRLFVATMMERSFSRDETMKSHPEWMITKGRGTWDYALPEVHDYQVKKIAWIMANHDIDGFVVDYTRYGHYFNEDEPDKFGHMNAFLRKLRAATDEVNANKDRQVLLCATFADEGFFIKHWGTGRLQDQGLDVPTWLKEKTFDMIMPESPRDLDYVRMAEGTSTVVWPRKVGQHTFGTDTHLGGTMSPKAIEQGTKDYVDAGASGIFFFNHDTWTTFGRLGFREELDLRTRTEEVYGFEEGPAVTFATWYPTVSERDAQREALKPATVACDREQGVEGEVAIPILNTFKEPVTATVSWHQSDEDGAEPWAITPATRTVSIAPGQSASMPFEMTGSAPTQTSVPAAEIVLASGEQPVFRHRLPVRAVQHMLCKEVEGEPAMESLETQDFFRVGGAGEAKGKMAIARDDSNLYILYDCAGIDAAAIDRAPQKRDSAEARNADGIEVLIDTDGAEQQYRQFFANAAGGQADALWRYEKFMGHHAAKRQWNADWTTRTDWREDGYTLTVRIPFEAVGAKPEPGVTWRVNIVARSRAGQDKPAVGSWSTPEKNCDRPRCFGAVTFK